jgi:hypothetical protein
MKAALRIPFAVAGLLLLAWIGWTAIQVTRADALAQTDPEAALRIDPDHPQALLRLAWRQLGNDDTEAAMATARHLLAVEPGQGDAFAVLALAAAKRGDANADALAKIALQRAPRNRDLRTQEAARALRAGDLPAAMAQIDALLRLTPSRGKTLYPALAQQSADPAFAEALAATLSADPPWRRAFLNVLGSQGTGVAVDRIYSALRRRGELPEAETTRWLDRMLADGRWGEAYAHWVGTLGPVQSIPLVRNGNFESELSGMGFGWRNTRAAGVFTDVAEGAGRNDSRGAHMHFIARPAARGNLRQALLLAPGRYRLSLQARAEFLRSDQGLYWSIRCDKGRTVAKLGPLEGSSEWREMTAEFEIPAEKCPGQWLELVNPAVRGSAQQVSGDLWIDDVAITPLPAS